MTATLLTEAYKSSTLLRKRLIMHLQKQDSLHSKTIMSALLMTPREAFVPFFLQLDTPTFPLPKRMPWSKRDASHHDYLSQVYQDQLLVTHLDAYGIPHSGSNQPTQMIQMLEALDIQNHHTVLEIGTGSGYNAAVIAHLAKACTTIDIEPVYVEHMRQIIQHFQLDRITSAIADGLEGYPENAPYDRIIVTASTPIIPTVWIDQLQDGGRLVCELKGPLERAFLVLDKTSDGIVHGTFHPTILKIRSMESETLPDPYSIPLFKIANIAPTQDIDPSEELNDLAQNLYESRSFRWFLQWHLRPIDLQKILDLEKFRFCLIAPDERSYITFSRDIVAQTWWATLHSEKETRPSWWDDIMQSYQIWRELGQPEVEHYVIGIDHEQLVLQIRGMTIPMQNVPTKQSNISAKITFFRHG